MIRQPQILLPYKRRTVPFEVSVVVHNWQAQVELRPAGYRGTVTLMGDNRTLASELRHIADQLEGEVR